MAGRIRGGLGLAVSAGLLAIVAVFCARAWDPAAAISAEAGAKPPPIQVECPRGKGPCGPIVTLGSVRDVSGVTRIVARRFDGGARDGGLCTTFREQGYSTISCHDGSPVPKHEAAIAGRMLKLTSGENGDTQIFGAVIAPVRSVVVKFRSAGESKSRSAKLARTKAEDLEDLGAPHKFSAFLATLPDCGSLRDVKLQARSSSGKVVGVLRPRTIGQNCDRLSEAGALVLSAPFKRHGR